MPDGLIFDIDGTLWDCTDVAAIGYNRAIAHFPQLDVHVEGADLRRLFGRPMQEIMQVLFPGLTAEMHDKIHERIRQEEWILLREHRPQAYPGARETLEVLSAQMPLYIVSNCQAGYPELMMELTGLTPFFSGHFCPADTGMLKADNIAMVRRKFGLKKTFYIGDTAGDETACRESDTPFIFASYGFGAAEAPDKIIRSISDLCDLIVAPGIDS